MANEPETANASRRFQPEDVLRQAQVQDLSLSPDGETIVYSRRVIVDGKYQSHLWRVGWAGEGARQLTFANANDSAPVCAPDGSTLAFISDRGGRKQPWLLPLDGGEPRVAAEIAGESKAIQWSPDGSRLLVLASSGVERLTVGDPADPTARVIDDFGWRLDAYGFRNQLTSVWVTDPDGGAARRISDPTWEVLDARWLPDGRHIVAVADADEDPGMRRFTERAAAWRLAVDEEQAPEELAALPGGVAAARPAPSGDLLAVIGKDFPGQPSWADNHLSIVSGEGLRRLAPELDRPVENVTTGDLMVRGARIACEWLDTQSIVAQVGIGGRTLPYQFDVASGSAAPLLDGVFVCNSIAVGGGRIAMVATDRGRPSEVYAVESGQARQISRNGSDWLEAQRRDPVRHVFRHAAGHEIETWLIEGNAPRPGPVVIQIHGGPHAAHGPTPWLEMLALADAGYHVLYPNPRGSSGYGEEFARAIHGRWGEVDGSDHLALVDWAVQWGLADPARIGVMGLSGGGYMTTWLLGHHPGMFKAAVAENPVSNWVSWYGGSDLTGYTDDRFVGIGRLPEDVDAFLAASPFMAIHQNRAPLLLLQSENDLRCPPEQSEILFAILRSRGVTTQMVRYPGEPHFLAGIGRPDRRVDRMRRIVAWFETYL
ncbi:MAG: S9 family peptidase [Thermomicrobiales bacterium]